jgi:hypothetical protein
MDEAELSKYMSEMGRKGALARAKRLTAEERREIARKAGTASGKVRSKKAKKKRRGTKVRRGVA